MNYKFFYVAFVVKFNIVVQVNFYIHYNTKKYVSDNYKRTKNGQQTQPHHLHQQPEREDQEGGPEEVSVRHLLTVWPDSGHCGTENIEDERTGFCYL